jgi:hypothetical protein
VQVVNGGAAPPSKELLEQQKLEEEAQAQFKAGAIRIEEGADEEEGMEVDGGTPLAKRKAAAAEAAAEGVGAAPAPSLGCTPCAALCLVQCSTHTAHVARAAGCRAGVWGRRSPGPRQIATRACRRR